MRSVEFMPKLGLSDGGWSESQGGWPGSSADVRFHTGHWLDAMQFQI